MISVNDFENAISDQRAFFFVGAGASVPSGIPTRFAEEAGSVFLPPRGTEFESHIVHVIGDRNLKIQGIQQERLFEAARRTYAPLCRSNEQLTGTLSLWKALDRETLYSFRTSCQPNLYHYAMVRYSHDAGVPIFTTNFDCLFEMAAEELGLPFTVILPGNAGADAIRNNAAIPHLFIVKLHGSIRLDGKLALHTLACDMQTITRPDPDLLESLEALCATQRICFVGYSGSDLDYFPRIRVMSSRQSLRAFWVDYAFGGAPITTAERNADLIGASKVSAQKACEILARVTKDRRIYDLPAPDIDVVFKHLRLETENALPIVAPLQNLTLAYCLVGIGRYGAALSVYAKYRTEIRQLMPELDQLSLDLFEARLNDGVSKYRESEDIASNVLQHVNRRPSTATSMGSELRKSAIRARAIHQIAMSRKLQKMQPELDSGMSILDKLTIYTTEIGRQVFDYWRLTLAFREKPSAHQLAQINDHLEQSICREQRHLALCAKNDFLVAMSAIPVRALRRPRPWLKYARQGLRLLLERLRKRIQNDGDFFAFVNVHKYLASLEHQNNHMAFASQGLLEITADPLNQAGNLLLRSVGMAPSAKIANYRTASGLARESGSAAAELKVLLALERETRLDSEEIARVDELVKQCSGEAFERLSARRELLSKVGV